MPTTLFDDLILTFLSIVATLSYSKNFWNVPIKVLLANKMILHSYIMLMVLHNLE